MGLEVNLQGTILQKWEGIKKNTNLEALALSNPGPTLLLGYCESLVWLIVYYQVGKLEIQIQ